METTVVSESPAAAPGCICPGLGPGPLYTHTRAHARTQALGEPRTEQSLPHVPSSRDKTAKGRADPALCQGNKAWLPHRGTRSGPDTSLAGGPPYVYMCVHA